MTEVTDACRSVPPTRWDADETRPGNNEGVIQRPTSSPRVLSTTGKVGPRVIGN
jgi:hypothetical protein